MLDRLAAGYRCRLRLFLDLAGETDPAGKATRAVAEAFDPPGSGADAVCRRLLACSCAWRERAKTVALAAGRMTLREALGRRAEDVGGALEEPPVLFCDSSLVGLARWLRAAGHDARHCITARAIDLVAEASRKHGILLTTDHRCLEFGALRDGRLPALWLPSNLRSVEQLQLVIGDLDLSRLAPRCMACGGIQAAVAKQRVSEQIPPRTARWLEEYSACQDCGRLYWRGTHWERIGRTLDRAFGECVL
jgi:uncharacterized protein